jgi:hypothetical protein
MKLYYGVKEFGCAMCGELTFYKYILIAVIINL